nr:substrate-binding domain-containing protein [Polymorphobacter sp.]
MRRPTSFDIAALAGVSQPTVSRALSGNASVSEATRLRVFEAAETLNYKVDKNASNLRRQASKTLALLFFEDPTPDDSSINPFYLSMLGSITRTCALRGYDLLISFQQLSGNWHVDYEDSRKADGIILLGYGDYLLYRPRLEQLLEQGTHFVRWGSAQAGQLGTTIGSDNAQGGLDAVRHLLAQGRRRIAFLGTASAQYPEFLERYRGYAAALAEAGMAAEPALQADAISTEEAGHHAAEQLLAAGTGFDAVFAASDLIAIGAMRALGEAGRLVPRAVAVVGFDDLPAASLSSPPLTTVMQDPRRAGEVLVDTLLTLIRGEAVGNAILPVRLVARGSSAS